MDLGVSIWRSEGREKRERIGILEEEIRNCDLKFYQPLFRGENMDGEREKERELNLSKRRDEER